MAIKKGWLLLLFGGLLLLVVGYFGHKQWRHAQLAKALHDPDPVVRMDAVRKAGPDGQGDLLIEALRDDDPDIRYVAAGMLRRVGPDNAEKIRGLLELSKDDHKYVREHAVESLRYLPAGARAFIYKGVEDEDPRIRAGSAYALAYFPGIEVGMGYRLSPPARPPGEEKTIARLIIPLMKDENLGVRKAAYFCLFSYALDEVEAARVVSTLQEALAETDQDARDLADRLLRWMKQPIRVGNRFSE